MLPRNGDGNFCHTHKSTRFGFSNMESLSWMLRTVSFVAAYLSTVSHVGTALVLAGTLMETLWPPSTTSLVLSSCGTPTVDAQLNWTVASGNNNNKIQNLYSAIFSECSMALCIVSLTSRPAMIHKASIRITLFCQ